MNYTLASSKLALFVLVSNYKGALVFSKRRHIRMLAAKKQAFIFSCIIRRSSCNF